MNEPTTYVIVVKGRASARLLRPLLDDFTIEHDADGAATHLVGEVSDAAHLHGILAHLTSVNAELISVSRQCPTIHPNPNPNPKEANNLP
jgi:hypothetical protein